jgi:hypothetical protein
MIGTIFCLRCGSHSCLHLQESRDNMLSMRQRSIIRLLCDPVSGNHKAIAFTLRLTYGSLKVEISRLYEKLNDFGFHINTSDKLVIYGFAHHEDLAIPLPTLEQYHPLESQENA